GRIDAELGDRDLEGDRVHALAHLGPAMTDLDGSILNEADDGTNVLLEPVAEAAVLQPESQPDRPSGGDGGVIVGAHLVKAALGAEAPVVHHLAGSPHLAGADDVALADL